MTEPHCKTCSCFTPSIRFNNDGTVTLLNGAEMPKCSVCESDLLPTDREIISDHDGVAHELCHRLRGAGMM